MADFDPAMIAALAGPPGSVDAAAQRQRPSGLAELYGASGVSREQLGQRIAERRQKPQGSGRIAARRQQLMGEGLSHTDAMLQMAKEGLVNPRLAEHIASIGKATGGM